MLTYTCTVEGIVYAVTVTAESANGQLYQCNGRQVNGPAWFTNKWVPATQVKYILN